MPLESSSRGGRVDEARRGEARPGLPVEGWTRKSRHHHQVGSIHRGGGGQQQLSKQEERTTASVSPCGSKPYSWPMQQGPDGLISSSVNGRQGFGMRASTNQCNVLLSPPTSCLSVMPSLLCLIILPNMKPLKCICNLIFATSERPVLSAQWESAVQTAESKSNAPARAFRSSRFGPVKSEGERGRKQERSVRVCCSASDERVVNCM